VEYLVYSRWRCATAVIGYSTYRQAAKTCCGYNSRSRRVTICATRWQRRPAISSLDLSVCRRKTALVGRAAAAGRLMSRRRWRTSSRRLWASRWDSSARPSWRRRSPATRSRAWSARSWSAFAGRTGRVSASDECCRVETDLDSADRPTLSPPVYKHNTHQLPW